MSKPRTFLRAFSGGEMSPEMYSRIDDARFQTGAAKIRNMVVNPQGTVTRRGGLEFVAKTIGLHQAHARHSVHVFG